MSGALSRSVGAKLFTLVFLVLLLNLGLLGYANVRLHRSHLETARLASAERMSWFVQRSTSYYMLRNDRPALRHIIETVGNEAGIESLRILDPAGRIRFSTNGREVGDRVLPGELEASPARRGAPATSLGMTRVRSANGTRVLSTLTPIRNAPTCASAACHAHPESQQVLGLLELDLSLAAADTDIRHATWQFIALSALAMILTLAATGIFVWRFVHRPVRVLKHGTERLGLGELGVQIDFRSDDELGELADSFNLMSRQLRSARDEITAWALTLEQRVEQKAAELGRAHEAMIEAEKLSSLGKLAAVVAHEINNPLSGILTYAKLMRKWIERGDTLSDHAEEMRDSLQLIESESRRCGEIVHNLLAFARAHPLNISDVDVNRIIKQCIKLVEHKLDLANISAHLELEAELQPIRGDAGQIEQLLLAMVMNAIEAMPHEGMLHIVTRNDGDHVVISIQDDGVGIPTDLLPRLFEPFVTTKDDGKGGVGLGLAISRSIVDRHHGKIDVQSEVGRGTTFTITLPALSNDPTHSQFSILNSQFGPPAEGELRIEN